MRRLVLLRHAKAEPAGGVDDVLRPLALNGGARPVGSVLPSPTPRSSRSWCCARRRCAPARRGNSLRRTSVTSTRRSW
ncbi:hypothetical protein NKG05_29930 [Oerskovia sp. M15]